MEGTISPLCLRSSSSLCYFSSNVSLDSHRSLGFTLVDSLRPTNLVSLRTGNRRLFLSPARGALRTPTLTAEEVKDVPMPKIDKSGRLSSPRAARELALVTLYAACLEGSDPIRLFEKRINARREPGYEFDKSSLLEYNHMSFGGPPVKTETSEEEDELVRHDENESKIEAEVLSAPPKLVYSKLVLRFAKKLLAAVADKWDSHVVIIEKISPPDWKSAPAGRILEFSILHLAMSEMAVLETRHPIVINEAVDLAKRFCDGSAPRIINGCLRTFVKDRAAAATPTPQALKLKQEVSV
ncbi:transcription antitermination protein NusB [Brassica rapa]|uniref:NusB/RsmB/TIM44 domain-containing protein n=1 Tax=Brassica campestris TaxID=3711 RepID=M4ECD6_BRACM|nr:transcription antitermination protein NusB [Brassica rapa]